MDVWSAGCILALMLLRRPLFRASDPMERLKKVAEVLGMLHLAVPSVGVTRRTRTRMRAHTTTTAPADTRAYADAPAFARVRAPTPANTRALWALCDLFAVPVATFVGTVTVLPRWQGLCQPMTSVSVRMSAYDDL